MNLRKWFSCIAVSSVVAAGGGASAAEPDKIKFLPGASSASVKGPETWFTGTVRIDAPFQAESPARTGGATVTFEPGARTAWHTHPLGQTLLITQGRGYVQEWGKPHREMKPGDIVWIPENVKHWHGAAENTAMSHIAIAEQLDGSSVEWMEQVNDRQYGGEMR